jgi:hypothetical protein
MENLNKDNLLSEKQGIESVQKKKQAVKYRHVDSQKPQKGHTLFEINTVTLEVSEAEFILNKTISWFEAIQIQKGTFKYRVVTRSKCVYISALNAKSAIARYMNGKGSYLKPSGNGLSIRLF